MLQRAGIVRNGLFTHTVWSPIWFPATLCIARDSAQAVERLGVQLRPVKWARKGTPEAVEVIPVELDLEFFDPLHLMSLSKESNPTGMFVDPEMERSVREADTSGVCRECGRWKWRISGYWDLPLRAEVLDRLRDTQPPVVSGLEVFGYGAEVDQPVLYRHDVAEALTQIDPEYLSVADVPDCATARPSRPSP